MTKKEQRRIEQEHINYQIGELMEDLEREMKELYPYGMPYNAKGARLRSSTADVFETRSFYILRSYNTIIAGIGKATDTCFDFLRKVYGYTATSAQHVSKFDHDYGNGKWGCTRRLTWYDAR